MDEEKHYPGQEEPVTPPAAPEPEQKEPEKAPEAKPEAEAKPEEPAKESEAEKKPEEPELPKKRSIYDDLKEERKQRQAAETELAAIKAKQEEAVTPEQKAEAHDELEKFAEDQGLSQDEIDKFVGLIEKRLGDRIPANLNDALAEIEDWKKTRQRDAEDAEIRNQSTHIRETLSIQNDDETKAVTDEVIRLSHTEEFHDKELDYILWKKKDDLSKLVSPKRRSFEGGNQQPQSDPAGEPDYGAGNVTPEQMTQATASSRHTSGYEIHRS